MTRLLGILALAAGFGVAGCASDGSWNSSASSDNGNSYDMNARANNNTSDTSGMSSQAAGNNNQNNDIQLRSGNDKTTASLGLAEADRRFLTDATAGGLYEVQAGTIAVAKTQDAQVKNIAQRMIDDHTKANDHLQALTQRKGFQAPVYLTSDQVKMIDDLNKLSAADFDREYIRQQKSAHQDAISAFELAANNGTDRDIRDFAAQTLPTLREHLQMINGDSVNLGSEK